MNPVLRLTASLVLVAASTAPAAAALRYTHFQTNDGINVLVVSGMFDFDDQPAALAAEVRNNGSTMITFDSPGGNVYAAMAIGRAIRLLGLNTLQVRQMECSSACTLAFLGGVQRAAAPGSIGVHRSSFRPEAALDRDDAVAGVQIMTADLLAYLKEMGVNQDLLGFALRYDASDMRYLSGSEMADLGVVNTGAAAGGATSPASPPPSPSEESRTAEQAAIELVRLLIEGDSRASLDAVSVWYAPEIAYYGRSAPLSEVLADKQTYFQRWPQRRYRIRDHSLEVVCHADHCQVSGDYEWEVRSQARNKAASGVARFMYTISRGSSPKVTGEAGFVLR